MLEIEFESYEDRMKWRVEWLSLTPPLRFSLPAWEASAWAVESQWEGVSLSDPDSGGLSPRGS